jgi:hypothetical protein
MDIEKHGLTRSVSRFSPLASLLKIAGSLHLAVVLIAVYAAVLAWATLVERSYHDHGGAAAHFGIYDAGWFTGINVLLAVNVLCAMLIRLPWKRQQTGFVMTHAGILVLLAGCLLTQQFGIEAQLPIFEGHTAHRAFQDSYHLQLRVSPLGNEKTDSAVRQNLEVICVPFVPGPFSWQKYDELPWFPWRVAYRSGGTIFDEDGISLETLDYSAEPEPSARVRLTVDGTAREFDVPLAAEDSPARVKKCTVEGKQRRVTVALRQDEVDLGFQLYLREFRRKLDPGAVMASHYSSLVDVLDRSDPPQKLRPNVLITLNSPIDCTDPTTGRTYRLFQSSFDGPWVPGEAEFDSLACGDRSRDRVYLSRLSVNYDPGRTLKHIGCLMIVVGIAIVYYLRP